MPWTRTTQVWAMTSWLPSSGRVTKEIFWSLSTYCVRSRQWLIGQEAMNEWSALTFR